MRGRGDSEGLFVPYRNEGHDGYDALEWCGGQPWSTGKVARYLTTMIAMVSPSDPFVEFSLGEPIPLEADWYFFTSGHELQNVESYRMSRR